MTSRGGAEQAGAGWRAAFVATGVYLAATLAFFAVALPGLVSSIPGGPVAGVDGWQQVWHLWWVQRALAGGLNPFQVPLIFHPDGVNLAIHPLNLATGILFAPVTATAGPVVAFNLALLSSFVLTALGGYLLALRAGARPAAAIVAGLLLSFGPFHVTKAYDGQLEFVALQWMALYTWLLVVAAETRPWRWPLLAGLMLAVVGYTSLYYLIFSAILSLLVVALWWPRGDRGAQRAEGHSQRAGQGVQPGWARIGAYLARLATVGLVAGLALTPLLLNLSDALGAVVGGGPLGPADPAELASRSANLLDFWLPSYLHPLWGPAVASLGQLLHPGIAAWNHALGYSAVGLALVACLVAWGRAWRWLVIALAGLVLALGPTLIVGTIDTGLPLPYRLLMLVPGMGVSRRPGHLVVLACLALTPLAGLGLSWLVGRFGRRALAAALALAALELAPPVWGTQPFVVHQVYHELAARRGALIALPIDIDSSEPLRDQIVHGRPIVGGFLARTPPYPFADLTPGVRQLWRLAPDDSSLADPAGATPAAALAAYGISDVVVSWGKLDPARRAEAAAALAQVLPGVAPSYDDGALAVYPVPAAPPAPLAFFGPGWYAEERDGPRRWRWMGPAGELRLVNPAPTAAPVSLLLRAESYGQQRDVALALNGSPAGTWTVSAQPTATARSLRLLLPPGESRLTLSAVAAAAPGRDGPISISVTAVTITAGS